jgi:hypothetical protein
MRKAPGKTDGEQPFGEFGKLQGLAQSLLRRHAAQSPEVSRVAGARFRIDHAAILTEGKFNPVRISTLDDLNTEWTGGILDATGRGFSISSTTLPATA